MCQRGDSPNASPVIRVCTLAAEVSFDGITISLELLRAISSAFFRHLAQLDDAHVGAAVSRNTFQERWPSATCFASRWFMVPFVETPAPAVIAKRSAHALPKAAAQSASE